jgi:hypothetical protein
MVRGVGGSNISTLLFVLLYTEPDVNKHPHRIAGIQGVPGMSIPVGSQRTIEVVMNGVAAANGGNAKNIANVYHFFRTTNVNPVSKAHIETAFQGAIGALVIALLNVRYAQTTTTVRIVDDAQDQAVIFPEAGVGAIAGDSMAVEDMAFLLMRTGIRGKSFKGNKKYGPLSETDSTLATADVLNAAAIARFNTLSAALLAGFGDADGNHWQTMVLSRELSQLILNPTNVIAFPVVQLALNHRISSMRRRKIASVYV